MPELSVVTPSYNQGCYLEATLRSVLQQKSEIDLQYIVVDAESKDDTPDVLSRYADAIDTLIVEPDEGQADALVKGFRHATGSVLAYLNSDDQLLPGTARWVVDYFDRHPGVDVLYGHRVFTDADGCARRFWILPPHSDYLMRRWDYIPQETCFWRRSVMDRFGGIDPTFSFAMDYEFFARVMPHVTFRRVNRFLASFREHDASKTTRLNDTLGQREVMRVRAMHDIRLSRWDHQVARLLSLSINAVSGAVRPWLLRDDRYLRFAP